MPGLTCTAFRRLLCCAGMQAGGGTCRSCTPEGAMLDPPGATGWMQQTTPSTTRTLAPPGVPWCDAPCLTIAGFTCAAASEQ